MSAQSQGYPLLLHLLFAQNCYEMVLKARQQFATLAERGQSEAIKYYWRYCDNFAEAPASRKALEEFVATLPQVSIDALAPELDEAETAAAPGTVTDFNSIFSDTYQQADRDYVSACAHNAARLAQGQPEQGQLIRHLEKTYGDDQSKWPWTNIAETYLRQKLAANPFKDDEGQTGGVYQENTDKVRDRILEAFAEAANTPASLALSLSATATNGPGRYIVALRTAGEEPRQALNRLTAKNLDVWRANYLAVGLWVHDGEHMEPLNSLEQVRVQKSALTISGVFLHSSSRYAVQAGLMSMAVLYRSLLDELSEASKMAQLSTCVRKQLDGQRPNYERIFRP